MDKTITLTFNHISVVHNQLQNQYQLVTTHIIPPLIQIIISEFCEICIIMYFLFIFNDVFITNASAHPV